jgi:uroporphyrin-III C-methyltransferase / precorrin-2 dehydrogenase / sirohydrochlorin ferrochelatase
MRYFPIFVDLQGQRVVVVGGGEEATRKIRLLLKTTAQIDVIAPELHEELASNGRVKWLARAFDAQLLDGARLVYSADKDLNATVSAAAQARGIPVNAVDEADISTFIVPSIVDRDPVVIAIGTEGTAPVLGQGIRASIDAQLPQELGQLASRAAKLRDYVASKVPHGNRRRSFWQSFFFGDVRRAFIAKDKQQFASTFRSAIENDAAKPVGRVSLVGAGPGDPELLTIKAHRKIQEADVIVHDRLVSPAILEMARRDAVRIPVGKTPFAPSTSQDAINAILVREASKGQIVVRLKGGDPYVFGRGGEEQAAVEAAGIAVDVVPGITAALGCAASAKLPITLRGQNRAFTLLTASSENGIADHDWATFAKPGQTFAIYMGLHAAGEVSSKLLDAGIDPMVSVTVVENGTLPNERVLKTSIGHLWECLTLNAVEGPAIIYVGLGERKANTKIVPFPVREDIRDAIMKAAS